MPQVHPAMHQGKKGPLNVDCIAPEHCRILLLVRKAHHVNLFGAFLCFGSFVSEKAARMGAGAA